jgi:hypothetical protein
MNDYSPHIEDTRMSVLFPKTISDLWTLTNMSDVTALVWFNSFAVDWEEPEITTLSHNDWRKLIISWKEVFNESTWTLYYPIINIKYNSNEKSIPIYTFHNNQWFVFWTSVVNMFSWLYIWPWWSVESWWNLWANITVWWGFSEKNIITDNINRVETIWNIWWYNVNYTITSFTDFTITWDNAIPWKTYVLDIYPTGSICTISLGSKVSNPFDEDLTLSSDKITRIVFITLSDWVLEIDSVRTKVETIAFPTIP